jgi:hypothetical protein
VSEEAESDAFLVPGVTLRDMSNNSVPPMELNIAPVWAYDRHVSWVNSNLEFEHPTSFGPFDETGENGRDEVRMIWYDVDRHAYYTMDISAMSSKNEAYAFAYWAIRKPANNGIPPYQNVYKAVTLRTSGKWGPFYRLRFKRTGDVLTGSFTSLADDDRTGRGPDYAVTPISDYTTQWNPNAGSEAWGHLNRDFNGGVITEAQVGVHLCGVQGMDAMKTIRDIQNNKLTLADALKIPQGIPAIPESATVGATTRDPRVIDIDVPF